MLRVLIWGTGSGAMKYLMKRSEILAYIDILAFIDGKKKDDALEYYRMPNNEMKLKISSKQISGFLYDYIVILSTYYEEIKHEAVDRGIDANKILDGEGLYKLWMKEGYSYFKTKYGSWVERKDYCISEKDSDYVWVSWLQGYEEAPVLVQKCIDSINCYSGRRKVILITWDNYRDYVCVPDYILQKLDNGIITMTFFSDILRLMLLERYGGLWVDATVYCLGEFSGLYQGNDFFAFQIMNDEVLASSWFIYSKKNHVFVQETLRLLLRYCKEMDCMEHYYIFHLFFRMVVECYDEEWRKIPLIEVSDCYFLSRNLNSIYNSEKLQNIKGKMPVQKLNRRQWIDTTKEDTFYEYIVS